MCMNKLIEFLNLEKIKYIINIIIVIDFILLILVLNENRVYRLELTLFFDLDFFSMGICLVVNFSFFYV